VGKCGRGPDALKSSNNWDERPTVVRRPEDQSDSAEAEMSQTILKFIKWEKKGCERGKMSPWTQQPTLIGWRNSLKGSGSKKTS